MSSQETMYAIMCGLHAHSLRTYSHLLQTAPTSAVRVAWGSASGLRSRTAAATTTRGRALPRAGRTRSRPPTAASSACAPASGESQTAAVSLHNT